MADPAIVFYQKADSSISATFDHVRFARHAPIHSCKTDVVAPFEDRL